MSDLKLIMSATWAYQLGSVVAYLFIAVLMERASRIVCSAAYVLSNEKCFVALGNESSVASKSACCSFCVFFRTFLSTMSAMAFSLSARVVRNSSIVACRAASV